MPYIGFGSTLGLGEESTWGTAVNRTNWIEVLRFNPARSIDRRPIDRLGQVGDTSRMRSSTYDAADQVDWTLDVVASYNDSTLMLLKHLLGAVATTGAGAPYSHKFTLGGVTNGLTMEFIRGNGLAEVVEGCTPLSATLSIVPGDYMRLSLSGVGETSGGLVSAGTPTYTSGGDPILYSQAGTLGWNSQTYTPVDVSLRIESGLEARRLLADKTPKQPIGTGYRTISATVTLEYENSNPMAALIAGTTSDLSITFTGSGHNSATIELHNAYIRSVSMPVEGPGVIRQTVEFIAQTDGTDLGLEITVTNANASATAN